MEEPEVEPDGGKPESRLKRKRPDAPSPALTPPGGNGNMKDLFGDSEDEEEIVADQRKDEQLPGTIRSRNAQLFGDSDDE